MTEPNQREKRHAALYFSPKNSSAYKELAARVRSDGGRTTLVWSNRWKGAESILTECRAIIIETGCANATDIKEAYQRYAVDCEIHFADANGEFAEDTEAAGDGTGFIEPDDTTDQNGDGSVDDEGAANDAQEHIDPDATPDAVVQAEDGGDGEDPVDPDSDGGDDGASDASGEEGQEEATDPERTSSN